MKDKIISLINELEEYKIILDTNRTAKRTLLVNSVKDKTIQDMLNDIDKNSHKIIKYNVNYIIQKLWKIIKD